MARSRKRSLWFGPEDPNGYNTDPDADGSTFLWLPCFTIGDIKNQRTLLPTDYKTGRNWRTRPIPGPNAWGFDLELPWYGLAAAAGSGVTPSATDDACAGILRHIMGAKARNAGRTVTSATSGGIVLTADTLAPQDIAPLFETDLPSAGEPRSMWFKVLTESPAATHTIAPDWPTTPSNAGIVYGTEIFTFDDDGGTTLSFIYRDDDLYWLCTGGRITAASIIAEVNKLAIFKVSVRGNSRTAFDPGDKASLPAAGSGPVATALQGLSSPVYFNGTEIITQKIEFDFGLNAGEPIEATRGVNGRSGDELIEAMPTVSINPLGTAAHEALQANATPGRMHIQIGQGVLSGGVLNTTCINIEEMIAEEAQPGDAGGRRRTALKFMTSDPVVFNGGSSAARVVQIGRA